MSKTELQSGRLAERRLSQAPHLSATSVRHICPCGTWRHLLMFTPSGYELTNEGEDDSEQRCCWKGDGHVHLQHLQEIH